MGNDTDAHSESQDYTSRNEARIDTKAVRCAQEDTTIRVADLTSTGMRLTLPVSKLPSIGDTKTYTFTDKDTGHQLTVEATVRWTRKGSVLTRKAEIGVEFIDLPTSHRDALLRLAVQGHLLISNHPETPEEDIAAEHTNGSLHINLYDILAVSPYASGNEIKSAFHKLVKQWHPDTNDDPQAPARMEELHKAYSILRDPTLRAKYDTRFGPDQAAA